MRQEHKKKQRKKPASGGAAQHMHAIHVRLRGSPKSAGLSTEPGSSTVDTTCLERGLERNKDARTPTHSSVPKNVVLWEWSSAAFCFVFSVLFYLFGCHFLFLNLPTVVQLGRQKPRRSSPLTDTVAGRAITAKSQQQEDAAKTRHAERNAVGLSIYSSSGGSVVFALFVIRK